MKHGNTNFINYRIGIKKVLDALGKKHPRYPDAATFEIQLVENIRHVELFGDTENYRHDRNRILGEITKLVLEILNKDFIDYCYSAPIEVKSNLALSQGQKLCYEFQEPEICFIPKGPFIMGSPLDLDLDAFDDEGPFHIVDLPTFYIASTPITNLQYAIFAMSGGEKCKLPRHWKSQFPSESIHSHPVVNVSLEDVLTFCRWLSKLTQKPYRLPTEAEWEKAARGDNGFLYPWGNKWMPEYANTRELNKGGTISVDDLPNSVSPYGVLSAVGNTYEWTNSLWGTDMRKPNFNYPYIQGDGRELSNAPSNVLRVIRGGSFLREKRYSRCASRDKLNPLNVRKDVGFRVALSPFD